MSSVHARYIGANGTGDQRDVCELDALSSFLNAIWYLLWHTNTPP